MSNRIDQLFKEKLSDHKEAPSAEAWAKIQSGLSKENKLVIAWPMAAVFVLFGATVGAWYFLSNDEVIKSTQLTEKKEIVTPQKKAIEKPVESKTESSKTNIAHPTKPESIKKRRTDNEIKKETQNSITESIAVNNGELQKQVENNLIVSEPVLNAQTPKPEMPIVIEFTLESISEKPTVAIAQTNEAESSGLKKILETARDVKNGDSDLSIIRDAKNQLFALDFKKDKTKRN